VKQIKLKLIVHETDYPQIMYVHRKNNCKINKIDKSVWKSTRT